VSQLKVHPIHTQVTGSGYHSTCLLASVPNGSQSQTVDY